jgi:hypothetical protein
MASAAAFALAESRASLSAANYCSASMAPFLAAAAAISLLASAMSASFLASDSLIFSCNTSSALALFSAATFSSASF